MNPKDALFVGNDMLIDTWAARNAGLIRVSLDA